MSIAKAIVERAILGYKGFPYQPVNRAGDTMTGPLNFGGLTSSFPRITNSGAQITFQLADGSANALVNGLSFRSLGPANSNHTLGEGFAGLGLGIGLNGSINFSNNVDAATGNFDLVLRRDAANTLAQRNGVNPQTSILYRTFTDVSNFAGMKMSSVGATSFISPTLAGTGSNSGLSLAGGNNNTGATLLLSASPVNIQFGTESIGWQVLDATGLYPVTNGTPTLGKAATGYKQLYIDYTNTAVVGAVTINKAAGRVNAAAAATSLVVTNSLVTAASHVMAWVSSADATARVTSVVPAAGSFTINMVGPTAQTSFDFLLISAD